jgi:hypothetical protein
MLDDLNSGTCFLQLSTTISTSLYIPPLLGILLLQQLCNSTKLNVTSTLINSTNLTITPILFRQPFPYKAHSAHPFNGLSRNFTGNLRSIKFGHGGIHDEILAGLLFASGIVDHGARGADFGPRLGELVLHALELADEGAELLAVVPDVAGGVGEGTHGQTGHLGGNANASFVEDANGVFVAVTFFAEKVALGDVTVVKVDYAGGRGLDAEFLFLFGDAEAFGVLVDDEGGDALVAL